MRLVVSGGGTGGHVYPILAVLDALQSRGDGATTPGGAQATPSRPAAPSGLQASAVESPGPGEPLPGAPVPAAVPRTDPAADGVYRAEPELTTDTVLYLGMASSAEQELTARAGIPFQAIESGQLRNMAPWVVGRNLLKIAQGARQAGRILADFTPDVVFVTGGFVAGPVTWAAWRAGVPILIYLPDMEPGLAIQQLSRFAARVAVSFPEVAHHFPGKAVVTGYPVRQAFLEAAERPREARQQLALSEHMPVLLVFGGSRGARSINQALAAVLDPLLEACQVVHVSGTLDWPQVEARAHQVPAVLQANYHPVPYLHEEMGLALAAADLVVARAGASTLGEFPAFGLPSILVPYPHSGQHQEVNADYLVSRGAARKVLDEELPDKLLTTILDLLNDSATLTAMSKAARALARPDAAAQIARELRNLAHRSGPAL